MKRFFGTSELPEIELSEKSLLDLAKSSLDVGKTVTGVQKKLSLNLSVDNKPRLTIVDYYAGYILKPQTPEYPFLPELEFITMKMAERAHIKTVPSALIPTSGNEFAYITKRIDRTPDADTGTVQKYAMEDFCQLGKRMTEDKYNGSYERCAKIIAFYSSQEALDLTEFFMRLVFCYIVGYSDMHLKNFSLAEFPYLFGDHQALPKTPEKTEMVLCFPLGFA